MLRLTLGAAAEYYRQNDPRGEYVLIVAGAPAAAEAVSLEQAVELVQGLIETGMSKKDAVRQIAQETGVAKNALYAAVL